MLHQHTIQNIAIVFAQAISGWCMYHIAMAFVTYFKHTWTEKECNEARFLFFGSLS
jgi:hypothetical protein